MGCCPSKPPKQSPGDQQAQPYHPVVLQHQTVAPVTSNYVHKAEVALPGNNAAQLQDNPSVHQSNQATFATIETELDVAESCPKAAKTAIGSEKALQKVEEVRGNARTKARFDAMVKKRKAAEAYVEEQMATLEADEPQNPLTPSVQTAHTPSSARKHVVSAPIPTTRYARATPLASWYEDTAPVKHPVSKFRRARDERGMALIREEEMARKEREIRARCTDPEEAHKAVDEFRRNYAAGRDVREQQQTGETRLRPNVTQSPLAGPPSAEERRQQPRPDTSPFVGFDVLRWD